MKRAFSSPARRRGIGETPSSVDALQRLLGRAQDEPVCAHELRMLLGFLSSAPTLHVGGGDRAAVAGELQFGPWRIEREKDGTIVWKPRRGLSIKERHSWRARRYSARRSSTDVVRILLIGESAAGSFGYWGHYSLASLIERRLNDIVPSTRFEVVDLSRINALWGVHCLQALHFGMSLEPDLALIYCGNNEARMLTASLAGMPLSRDGMLEARWFVERDEPQDRVRALNRHYEAHLSQLVHETSICARSFEVEPVFVVPEFNLRDWRGSEVMPHHLSGKSLSRWTDAVARGRQAQAEGCHDQAIVTFREAMKLDGQLCQASWAGLAAAYDAVGDTQAALGAYACAKDAGLGPFVDACPGITEGGAAVIRQKCGELEIPVVDLPRLMRSSAVGVPDRRFFIDYCHLTPAGHDLLARALASTIIERTEVGLSLPLRGRPDPERRKREARAAEPPAREAALGAVVAAIHNYQNAQSPEIVQYWLSESRRRWDGVEPLLEFIADHACSFFRERVTLAELRTNGIARLLKHEKYLFYFSRYFYHARFDVEMKDQIENVLARPRRRRRASLIRQTRGLLDDLHGDLHRLFFTDKRAGLSPVQRPMSRHGWERPALEMLATQPVAQVAFPWDHGGSAAVLTLEVCGVDGPLPRPTCAAAINGQRVGSNVTLKPGYCVHRFPVPADVLKSGLNGLELSFSRFYGLADQKEPHARRSYVERFEHYPVATRILGLSLVAEGGHDA